MESSFGCLTCGTFRISWRSYQGMLSARHFLIYVHLVSNVFCFLGQAPQVFEAITLLCAGGLTCV